MMKIIFILCIFAVLVFPVQAAARERLAWNGKEISGWVCDGKELKPKFGANNSNTYDVGGAPILVIAGKIALHLY